MRPLPAAGCLVLPDSSVECPRAMRRQVCCRQSNVIYIESMGCCTSHDTVREVVILCILYVRDDSKSQSGRRLLCISLSCAQYITQTILLA